MEAVKQGTGKVDAPALLKFFSTAAYKPEKLKGEAWRGMFHTKDRGDGEYHKKKTSIEQAEFELMLISGRMNL